MPTKVYETYIKAPVQKLWDFHSSPDALRILTPAEQEMQWISKSNPLRDGAIHEFKTKQFGLWISWKARITNVREPFGFTDTAVKSPFKSWVHHHDFIDEDGHCILRDTIHYELKAGPIGKIVNSLSIEEKIDKMFKYRHRTTKAHLETPKAAVNTELFDKQQEYISDMALNEPPATS
ncbi:MAG: SRPBCC family protein [Fimbriimonadaceae bacterium]